MNRDSHKELLHINCFMSWTSWDPNSYKQLIHNSKQRQVLNGTALGHSHPLPALGSWAERPPATRPARNSARKAWERCRNQGTCREQLEVPHQRLAKQKKVRNDGQKCISNILCITVIVIILKTIFLEWCGQMSQNTLLLGNQKVMLATLPTTCWLFGRPYPTMNL